MTEPTSPRAAPPFAPQFAIETENLSKTYAGARANPRALFNKTRPDRGAGREALRAVSLRVPRGAFFGLLGPNGAGKSTLINILAGLVIKTSGAARVWGYDIEAEMRGARGAIGVVPQELNIDPFFTPRELLELQAGLYGVPRGARRTDAILAAVGLADQANAYARALSGGMRRRLLVAKAMVHAPPVLVLDEPTAGVDVELRRQLWAHVRELNARGTTILLTTHYLEEAEALCDSIAIINRGRLIACEAKETLLRRLDSKEMTVTLAAPLGPRLPEPLARFHAENPVPDRLVFHYPPSRVDGGAILEAVRDAGLAVRDVSTRESDLEDIFLTLTRDAEAKR
jgi:ABC-2 type transport system ATP-binding protein